MTSRFITCWVFFFVLGTTVSTTFAEEPVANIPEIDWKTTVGKFQFDHEKFVGQRLTVRCAPAPARQDYSGIYGTDYYPSESPICIAALHAGVIDKEGGTVTIQLNPGRKGYQGSTRNGVTTADLPATERSIAFVTDAIADQLDEIHLNHIPRIGWDTKFTRSGFAYRQMIGQQFTFRCSPAPAELKSRMVFGTDRYDYSSLICRAALHAGKLNREGGIVTVRIDGKVGKLTGSIRNGIETKSKSGGDRTISFVKNPVELKKN